MYRSGSRRNAISRTHASPISPDSSNSALAPRWRTTARCGSGRSTTPPRPGARWFPGVRLNYVDQIVRNARTDRPAILHVSEDGQVTELSWQQLLTRTAAFAQALRSHGVTAGDRVVGYLPNVPEAVVAFLA